MIELNKKAKPFNPVEELIGSNLFFKMKKTQLCGSAYYQDSKDKVKGGIDVVGLITKTDYSKTIYYELVANGWTDANFYVPNFFTFSKKKNNLLLTTKLEDYTKFVNAQEVIKYMGGDVFTKEQIIAIHDIIMANGKVHLNMNGEVTGVHIPNEEEPVDMAEPAPAAPAGLVGAQLNYPGGAQVGGLFGGPAAMAAAVDHLMGDIVFNTDAL
jgi:hypothetical protein